jgi:HEAT repeat protein
MIMISRADDRDDDVKAVAISGRGYLAKNNLITPQILEQVVALLIKKSSHTEADARASALFGLSYLSKNSLIPVDKLDFVIALMVEKASDEDVHSRAYALNCLSNLSISNLIPKGKLNVVVLTILQKLSDSERIVRTNAIKGLANIAYKNCIPDDLIDEVTATMIRIADADYDYAMRIAALGILTYLAESDLIPSERIVELVMLVNAKSEDVDDKLRFYAIGGKQLAFITFYLESRSVYCYYCLRFELSGREQYDTSQQDHGFGAHNALEDE